jgi:hypothetical protein
MKFMPRAAMFAAVTFCAGALANAATLETMPTAQDVPVQANNPQEQQLVPSQREVAAPVVNQVPGEVVQPLPKAAVQEDQDFATLSAAVEAHQAQPVSDNELKCLATGIYYEAKSEPLAGQLAVAEVILNRAKSGRFAKSACGVLTQRGQFSFVRGGKIPTPPQGAQWRKALAVAQVAQKDLWDSPAGNALYFHARHARQNWNRVQVASIGNHIFYR